MLIRFSVTDDEYRILLDAAASESMSIQDYIRSTLLGDRTDSLFTPGRAVELALSKFKEGDSPWSLPDVYGDLWSSLDQKLAGPFGKRFYNHIKNIDKIEFVGMDKRRATYRIVG